MQIFKGYQNVPPAVRGSVLAIGNFDGVHRGHQALLSATIVAARQRGVRSGAMVFEPHPRAFFKPDEPLFALTTLDEKLRLFEALELDFATIITFDATLAGMTPADFADKVLAHGFGVSHVVVGYDFYFGKARAGTPETMRQLGHERGFGVTVIAPVAEAGEVLSSSAVRTRLSAGDVRGAAVELGHWWRIRGVVTGGAKRGTGMGFPTANVVLAAGTALGHGIFAVRVRFDMPGGDRRTLQGAAYFGQRPTFDNGAPVLEVFLFDFDGDLYGREIEVEFVGFVRPDQRFPDMAALKLQMDKDCAQARVLIRQAEQDHLLDGLPLGRS